MVVVGATMRGFQRTAPVKRNHLTVSKRYVALGKEEMDRLDPTGVMEA